MKVPARLLAASTLLLGSALPSAFAFTAAEDFGSYSPPVNFTNASIIGTAGAGAAGTGAAGNGWLNGWRTSTSTGLQQPVGVSDTTPVNSGGNYLAATIVTKSVVTDTIKDSTSVARAYDALGGGVAAAGSLAIGFDFRVDGIDAANMRYDLFDNATRATGATSTSFNFRATGGVWNYFDGETFVATAMAFDAGVTYSFDIVLDTVNSTYSFTLGNGSTSVSSSSAADFRAAGFATDTATGSNGGRWLTFNASEINNVLGQSTTFSLDNISVSTVPEPSAFALLAGASALGFFATRRRRLNR